MRASGARGFSLLELLLALGIGLALTATFLLVLQRCRVLFTAGESLAQVHEASRQALGVMVSDIEHAGFYGFAIGRRYRLVENGTELAQELQMRQPTPEQAAPPVPGLPAGAHDCGVNFAVDLSRPVQGTDNGFEASRACAPTAAAGGARLSSDTLTVRRASLGTTEPRAGRLQLYSVAAMSQSLLLFADGRAPGPRDDRHEVRDLEVRTYYVANHSVGRPGLPALRVKALTESGGSAQFRDEELMPGVEDLQVELGVSSVEAGEPRVRFVDAGSAAARQRRIVAVRLWLRVRAEHTEPGFHDDRGLGYSNVSFSPDNVERDQRRVLLMRTVALRNPSP
jgi:type IV pilus assembly protein PilW